jgi:hypothetical protein
MKRSVARAVRLKRISRAVHVKRHRLSAEWHASVIQELRVYGVSRATWVTPGLKQQLGLATHGERDRLHHQATVSDSSLRNHAREHSADRTVGRVRPAFSGNPVRTRRQDEPDETRTRTVQKERHVNAGKRLAIQQYHSLRTKRNRISGISANSFGKRAFWSVSRSCQDPSRSYSVIGKMPIPAGLIFIAVLRTLLLLIQVVSKSI